MYVLIFMYILTCVISLVKYGNRHASFEQVEAAAESAQIKGFIERLPQGWMTKVGERGKLYGP